jgi:hypothetical protein
MNWFCTKMMVLAIIGYGLLAALTPITFNFYLTVCLLSMTLLSEATMNIISEFVEKK